MKNNAVKTQFVEMRVQGQSFASIAKKLKVSKQTLISWSQELQGQIANLESLQRDELRRRLKLTHEAQFEILGDMLNRLREEFSRRDLVSLPTERLLEQIIRLNSIVAEKLQNHPLNLTIQEKMTDEEISASINSPTRVVTSSWTL